mgnify:CR=1 FL=1
MLRFQHQFMLDKKQKQEIIDSYATSKRDTGSPQVQIALLTHQLQDLTDHLEGHPKDNHSRRGLIKIVGKRRRLLNYLGQSNPKAYQDLVKELNIRQAKIKSSAEAQDKPSSDAFEKLSTRTENALLDANMTVDKLSKLSEEEILEIDGIGKKGLQEIKKEILK